jgi:hypothetical protein
MMGKPRMCKSYLWAGESRAPVAGPSMRALWAREDLPQKPWRVADRLTVSRVRNTMNIDKFVDDVFSLDRSESS